MKQVLTIPFGSTAIFRCRTFFGVYCYTFFLSLSLSPFNQLLALQALSVAEEVEGETTPEGEGEKVA